MTRFTCDHCQRGIFWMEAPILTVTHGTCCDECWPTVQASEPPRVSCHSNLEAVVRAAYIHEGGRSILDWLRAFDGNWEKAAQFMQKEYPDGWCFCYRKITGEEWPA